MTLANCISIFNKDVVTSEPWLRYTRSELFNEELSKRIPERKIVLLQSIKNDKARKLRMAVAELLQPSATKSQRRSPRKSNRKSSNKNRINRFNRFKNFHKIKPLQ